MSEVICSFQINSEVVPVAELRGHEDAVQAVVFDPNGNFMVSGSSDSTFRVWGDLHATPEPEYVSIKQNPTKSKLVLCFVYYQQVMHMEFKRLGFPVHTVILAPLTIFNFFFEFMMTQGCTDWRSAILLSLLICQKLRAKPSNPLFPI